MGEQRCRSARRGSVDDGIGDNGGGKSAHERRGLSVLASPRAQQRMCVDRRFFVAAPAAHSWLGHLDGWRTQPGDR